MNNTEIRALADEAREGNPKALREFKKLAQREGYFGKTGGMLYLRTVESPVGGKYLGVRGWQELASHVYFGQVVFTREEVTTAVHERAAQAEADLEAADEAAPVKVTPAQKRFILAALGNHGFIIFNGPTYSAFEQGKIIDRMVAAGLVVPGSHQITSQAMRAADPALFDELHGYALEDDHLHLDAKRQQAVRDAEHLAALEMDRAREEYPQDSRDHVHGPAILEHLHRKGVLDFLDTGPRGELLRGMAEYMLTGHQYREWLAAQHATAVEAAAVAHNNGEGCEHERRDWADFDRKQTAHSLEVHGGPCPHGGCPDCDL